MISFHRGVAKPRCPFQAEQSPLVPLVMSISFLCRIGGLAIDARRDHLPAAADPVQPMSKRTQLAGMTYPLALGLSDLGRGECL